MLASLAGRRVILHDVRTCKKIGEVVFDEVTSFNGQQLLFGFAGSKRDVVVGAENVLLWIRVNDDMQLEVRADAVSGQHFARPQLDGENCLLALLRTERGSERQHRMCLAERGKPNPAPPTLLGRVISAEVNGQWHVDGAAKTSLVAPAGAASSRKK